MGFDEIDIDSGLDFAYMVVDAKGQSTTKELEQKILYQFGLPGHMSTDQGTHFTDHNVKQWAERHLPQSNSFIENWNRQLKHWLFKTGEM